MKYAILLDAGFLKKNLGSPNNPVDSSHIVKFVSVIRKLPVLQDFRLHRVYYYDAEPFSLSKPKPLTGGKAKGQTVNFAATDLAKRNSAILDALKKEPFFALRLGETVFRGWSVKPQKLDPSRTMLQVEITEKDIIPTINQKGVDMRIGLDIASLSLKKQVDAIVLVSADSDFIPALKFARREGVQVFVLSLGWNIKPDLYAHTDMLISDKLHLSLPS